MISFQEEKICKRWRNIDGMKFYVKVKIVQENGEDILKCIGFHEDDFAQESNLVICQELFDKDFGKKW